MSKATIEAQRRLPQSVRDELRRICTETLMADARGLAAMNKPIDAAIHAEMMCEPEEEQEPPPSDPSP
jgi:hypothetical protein